MLVFDYCRPRVIAETEAVVRGKYIKHTTLWYLARTSAKRQIMVMFSTYLANPYLANPRWNMTHRLEHNDQQGDPSPFVRANVTSRRQGESSDSVVPNGNPATSAVFASVCSLLILWSPSWSIVPYDPRYSETAIISNCCERGCKFPPA